VIPMFSRPKIAFRPSMRRDIANSLIFSFGSDLRRAVSLSWTNYELIDIMRYPYKVSRSGPPEQGSFCTEPFFFFPFLLLLLQNDGVTVEGTVTQLSLPTFSHIPTRVDTRDFPPPLKLDPASQSNLSSEQTHAGLRIKEKIFLFLGQPLFVLPLAGICAALLFPRQRPPTRTLHLPVLRMLLTYLRLPVSDGSVMCVLAVLRISAFLYSPSNPETPAAKAFYVPPLSRPTFLAFPFLVLITLRTNFLPPPFLARIFAALFCNW